MISHNHFPNGWALVRLDDVAERATGHTPDKSESSYWDGEIKWVSLADSNKLDQLFISETAKKISEKGIQNSSAKLLPAGTVVLLRDAAVGRSSILASEMAVSQHFVAWVCGERLTNKFLYYYLQSQKPFFERMAVGSTIVTIGMGLFRKLKVPLPPRPEQDRIAATLEIWDHSIDLTERMIAAKQERLKWLMQQLLTGRKRLPGFDGEWPEIHIRDICKAVRRKNDKGITHVLTASGEHGLVDQMEYFNRSVSGESLDGYFLLRRGEFAYNRSSMNGYPYGAIKRLDAYDEGVLSTLYICFRLTSESCFSDFCKHLFEAGILNRQLREVVQVGARAHGLLNITLHDFFSLKICCPPIEEQQHISAIIDTADCELNLLRTQLDALREQKKGLMQQLLTGKVRVKTGGTDV